ncbi:MAG TPA: hypothetical protein VIM19_11620 [Actinomycetes bacterium]
MLCCIRFTRFLAGLLAVLLYRLSRRAAALYQRHRALLSDEPGYRAQATAGTAALLTLLHVPRPLAALLLGTLRRPTSRDTAQIEPVRDDPHHDTH